MIYIFTPALHITSCHKGIQEKSNIRFLLNRRQISGTSNYYGAPVFEIEFVSVLVGELEAFRLVDFEF